MCSATCALSLFLALHPTTCPSHDLVLFTYWPLPPECMTVLMASSIYPLTFCSGLQGVFLLHDLFKIIVNWNCCECLWRGGWAADVQPTAQGFKPLVLQHAGVHICVVEQMFPVVIILGFYLGYALQKKIPHCCQSRVWEVFSTGRRLSCFCKQCREAGLPPPIEFFLIAMGRVDISLSLSHFSLLNWDYKLEVLQLTSGSFMLSKHWIFWFLSCSQDKNKKVDHLLN